jgi:hypothetical protein
MTTSKIWIASWDALGGTYHVYDGPRTVLALLRRLESERRSGRGAHFELETVACGPVALSISEMVSLGAVAIDREEYATVRCRQFLEVRRKARRRAPARVGFLASLRATASRFGRLVTRLGSSRREWV